MYKIAIFLILSLLVKTVSAELTAGTRFWSNEKREQCRTRYNEDNGRKSTDSEFLYYVSQCQVKKESELKWLDKAYYSKPIFNKVPQEIYNHYKYKGLEGSEALTALATGTHNKNESKDISDKKINILLYSINELNMSWAAVELGEMYFSGVGGVEKNINKGINYFKQAENELKGVEGCLTLGGLHYDKYKTSPKQFSRKKGVEIYFSCLKKYKDWKHFGNKKEIAKKIWGFNRQSKIKCSSSDKFLLNTKLLPDYDLGVANYKPVCLLKDNEKALYHFKTYIETVNNVVNNYTKTIVSAELKISKTSATDRLISYEKENFHKKHQAYNHIGDIYLTNHDSEKNIEKAISFYEKGTKKVSINDIDSNLVSNELALATIYQTDKYNKKNIDRSLLWYEKAATHGSVGAKLNLGKIYLDKGNVSKAKKWIQDAYLNGSKEAEILWNERHLSEK